MPDAAAYDLSAGCTGFMYAIAQALRRCSPRASRSARSSSAATSSRGSLDWTDRSTLVLFGDGAGAVVLEPVERGGFLGFELGADGGGGLELLLPGSGSRRFDGRRDRFLTMNGREVFKFATRVMVSLGGGDSRRVRKDGRTTSTSTFPTRRTSGSSTTRRGSSAFPRRRSS